MFLFRFKKPFGGCSGMSHVLSPFGGFTPHSTSPNWTPCLVSLGCGSKPMGFHFGVGAPPILVYFSGDWDVHRGYGILTHGHFPLFSHRITPSQPLNPTPSSFSTAALSLDFTKSAASLRREARHMQDASVFCCSLFKTGCLSGIGFKGNPQFKTDATSSLLGEEKKQSKHRKRNKDKKRASRQTRKQTNRQTNCIDRGIDKQPRAGKQTN